MINKAKSHLGYLTTIVVVMIVASTVMAVAGYNTEMDIHKMVSQDKILLVGNYGRVAGVAVQQVEVRVDLSDQTVLSMNVEIVDDNTVMDALREMIKKSGLVFETTKYDFGELVDQIGDLRGGQENKYWIYYVNGKSALVSADTMAIKAGDVIEFRFEESIF